MKKTIIAAVTGIIFGFIGCIAAIAKIFSKLCEAPDIKDEIMGGIKNLITVAMYGNGSYYNYRYNGAQADYYVSHNAYRSYESKYKDSVIKSIGHIVFESESDLEEACELIEDWIRKCGRATVDDVHYILSDYTDKEFDHKYLDSKYGWINENAFREYHRPGDLQLYPTIPVKLAITEETA